MSRTLAFLLFFVITTPLAVHPADLLPQECFELALRGTCAYPEVVEAASSIAWGQVGIGAFGMLGSTASFAFWLPEATRVINREGLNRAAALVYVSRLLIDTCGAATAGLLIKHGLGY